MMTPPKKKRNIGTRFIIMNHTNTQVREKNGNINSK